MKLLLQPWVENTVRNSSGTPEDHLYNQSPFIIQGFPHNKIKLRVIYFTRFLIKL